MPAGPVYRDRSEAGRRLAERLAHFARQSPVVLALPRGGVPVAAVIAERLGAPLDVFVVRKIGAPGNPEYGLGAVTEGGTVLLDGDRIAALGLAPADLAGEIRRQSQEVESRVRRLRGTTPAVSLEGATVLVVDDGLATGGTARAAVRAIRTRRPRSVVLAVGVAAAEAHDTLAREVDELVCPCVPQAFWAVGEWYRDFSEVSDDDVLRMLRRHREALSPTSIRS